MVLIFSSSPTGFVSVSPTDLATVPIFLPYQFIVLIFSSSRPLVALCDSSGPGTAFMSVSFISLSTGEQVQKTSAHFFRDFFVTGTMYCYGTVRFKYEPKLSYFLTWDRKKLFRTILFSVLMFVMIKCPRYKCGCSDLCYAIYA